MCVCGGAMHTHTNTYDVNDDLTDFRGSAIASLYFFLATVALSVKHRIGPTPNVMTFDFQLILRERMCGGLWRKWHMGFGTRTCG